MRADSVAATRYELPQRTFETHYWLRLRSTSGGVAPDQAAALTGEANQPLATLTSVVKNARANQNGRSTRA